tara:strand:+ start:7289 stop:7546 length:258 start_codon:yes stop_codon:yes gene_type:complete
MEDKEFSDFKMERIECPKCGATWLNGQHYWKTGRVGDTKALSNLVCGVAPGPGCINEDHKEGHVYGEADTWQKRAQFINRWYEER